MNPYLATAIAMCAIVLLSLAGTAYLAAVFNRRAKSDLQTRLEPLAAVIDGAADVEEARVEGRFRGQIAIGRVANAPGGFGRLFHVELVDSAGGLPWEWSSLPDKKGPGLTRTFEGDAPTPSRSLTTGALGVAVRLADALQGRELPGERLRVGNVESGAHFAREAHHARRRIVEEAEALRAVVRHHGRRLLEVDA